MVLLYSIFNLCVRFGWVVTATSRPLNHGNDTLPIVQETGWGPRAGLDGCRKFRPHRYSNPRTVQPVASRYTDCAIPAHVPL